MIYLVTSYFGLLGVQATRAGADALRPLLVETLNNTDVTREPVECVALPYDSIIGKLVALEGTQATPWGERHLQQLKQAIEQIERNQEPLHWSVEARRAEQSYLASLQEDDISVDDKTVAFTFEGIGIVNPYRSSDYSCQVNPLITYHRHYVRWFNQSFAAVGSK